MIKFLNFLQTPEQSYEDDAEFIESRKNMKKITVSIALVLSLLFTFPIGSPAQKKKPHKPRGSSFKGAPSRNYIRGARGGCYYVSKGNKIYVDRSYCN